MGTAIGLGVAARGALERVHAWLFPPACRACGGLLAPPGFAALAPGYPHLCGACHAGLPWRQTPPRFDPGPLAWLDSATHYARPVDGWIQHLKYQRRLGVVRLLGRLLAESPAGAAALRDAPWVVPVPLHPRRLWGRGFNQSLLLAHAWLRAAAGKSDPTGGGLAGGGLAGGSAPGTPGAASPRLAADVLVRHRYTRPQVSVSAVERRTNVLGAFSLHPRLAGIAAPLAGRSVVLVDDVATTGATLHACAQVLREAGAERVRALVVAHG